MRKRDYAAAYPPPLASELLTLRDYFAAKAMQSLVTSAGVVATSFIAELAYEIVDAMLQERAK